MSSKARDLLKLAAVIAVAFGVGLTVAQTFNIPRPGVADTRPLVNVAPSTQMAAQIGRASCRERV